MQGIKSLRKTIKHDLSRLNLPANPSDALIITHALKYLCPRIQKLFEEAANTAFISSPEALKQEELGTFIFNLKKYYGLELDADCKSWSDTASIRSFFAAKFFNKLVQSYKTNPNVSDDELMVKIKEFKSKFAQINGDAITDPNSPAKDFNNLTKLFEFRERLLLAGMNEKERGDYELKRLGW